jgi:hypothetical protein
MILSLLRRYQLLAQAQAVAGKLQATLGMEPVIDSVQDQSLATLTQVITTSFAQWDDGMLSNQEQETLTSVSTE